MLFTVGLALGCALSIFVPYQFITWSLEELESGERGWVGAAGGLFLGVVSILTGARWCILFVLSFRTFLRQSRESRQPIASWPFVSVFVPAYNESQTIEAALQSLIALDYPAYEVIVIDDGSKDDTFERARQFEGRHEGCTIRVFRKANGGKWSAHNFAFARSRGELILCLDADSRIEPCSLRRMVVHFANPVISAVAGQIRVRNRVNALTWLQGLEYIMANGAMRMAQSASGTVLVVPGPIGLFRRSVLEEIYFRYGHREGALKRGEVLGPFEGDTFAEDFDLSMAILTLRGRIIYEPNAVSHTKAPDSLFALLNQRYRWGRGTIQVLRKLIGRARIRPEILRGRLLAWVAGTYALELVLVPVAYFAVMAIAVLSLAAGANLLPLLAWAGLFITVNSVAAALFTLMHNDHHAVLKAMPLYDLYQGVLLNSGWLIAVVDEIREARMRW
jgi:cellulose synthase/poly-beta-1,6-N-acetylglucosamine synthase-like glycosyltransferase